MPPCGKTSCGNAVYGVALNFRGELESLGEQLYRDPYKKPPVAPVLYLRPRNTWSTSGALIRMPADAKELKMAGTLGIVMGCLNHAAGYIVVNDVSIPHESYYRPPIRQRCRDGFCVIGSEIADREPREIRTFINGELRCRANIADLVRPIDQLIADITEFLTFQPGDILLIGEPPDSPLARIGDRVRVEIERLAAIENEVVAEAAPE
jgi:5-oxopent-3-ene-1,2,5-tricarboxylate decarboxylase / 2-hydroxyhepta-2,4-diene-1,7-dioate isomerase